VSAIAPTEATSTSHALSQQLVVFLLAGEQYALPIASVSEIIRHTRPRSITTTDPWVRGVIGLRGKIIPIYDLTARLNLPATADAESDKIVIVDTATGHVGVTVQEVEEVLTITSDQIEPVPAGGGGDGLDGIVKLGDRLVILLDPAALLGDPELAAD
jgi:purine-binding chemotaxis protein CheW